MERLRPGSSCVCKTSPSIRRTIGSSCASSTCKYTCSSGYGDCNANTADGCEVNIASDLNNCGACGSRCTIVNGAGICTGSSCRVQSCSSPFRDCNGNATDGCESNSNSDVRNCGSCGNACPARPNTSVTLCSGGGCGFSCVSGYANCDGSAVNGCETNINDDDNNCGSCGNGCGFAESCESGRCCLFGIFC